MKPPDEKLQAVIGAMRSARIPKAFITANASLEPYEKRGAGGLRTLLKTPRLQLDDGAVIIISDAKVRKGNACGIPVTYLTARSLTLQGIGVRCFTLPELADALRQSNYEFLQSMEDVRVLCVQGFFNPDLSEKASPFDAELTMKIMWLLYNWMMQGRALLLQIECDDITEAVWWPKTLLNELKTRTLIHATLK